MKGEFLWKEHTLLLWAAQGCLLYYILSLIRNKMHTHFWRCICLFSFLEMSILHGKPIDVLEFWFCFGYISHYVYTFVFLILYWCCGMFLFFFNWTFLSRKYRICLAVIKKKYHTCQAVISENISVQHTFSAGNYIIYHSFQE